MTTRAAAPSAPPLARPADLLTSADVVEVYCESLSNYAPLLYKCGYHLYSALTRADIWFHGGACLIMPLGRGFMVRLPRAEAWRVAALQDAEIEVGYHRVRIGEVTLRDIDPASELYSPLVIFDHTVRDPGGPKHGRKRSKTGDSLAMSIGVALAAKGIHGAKLTLEADGRRLDLGPKGAVIGQGATLKGLRPEDSIRLQREGLGAKSRMGCGVFIPVGSP